MARRAVPGRAGRSWATAGTPVPSSGSPGPGGPAGTAARSAVPRPDPAQGAVSAAARSAVPRADPRRPPPGSRLGLPGGRRSESSRARPPHRRPARFHGIDRHPGGGRRRAQPGPLLRGRPRGLRRPPGPARRAGRSACASARSRSRTLRRKRPSGPLCGTRGPAGCACWWGRTPRPRWPAGERTSCSTGSSGAVGPAADPRRAGRGQHARPREQGVPDRRWRPREAGSVPGQIVPVDSEHSAIAQCLRSGAESEVERLVLTASGGPFRGRRREDLRDVTAEQALAHPTWSMGPLVTTNSATLVNKGLEVIEAHLLFGVPLDRIDVWVHPQSIVHSMVQFNDGSTIAQCSPPDMRLPISLALGVARPGGGGAPPLRLDGPASLALRAAGRRGVPRGAAWRAGSGPSAGRILRCTTRRTRSASKPSSPAGSGSSTSSTPSSAWSPSTSDHELGTAPRSPTSTECSPRTPGRGDVPGSCCRHGGTPERRRREGNGLMYLLGVLVLVLGVIVSIALHEVGHLSPPSSSASSAPSTWSASARRCGRGGRGRPSTGSRPSRSAVTSA